MLYYSIAGIITVVIKYSCDFKPFIIFLFLVRLLFWEIDLDEKKDTGLNKTKNKMTSKQVWYGKNYTRKNITHIRVNLSIVFFFYYYYYSFLNFTLIEQFQYVVQYFTQLYFSSLLDQMKNKWLRYNILRECR